MHEEARLHRHLICLFNEVGPGAEVGRIPSSLTGGTSQCQHQKSSQEPLQNACAEALTPRVTIFGDVAFKQVIQGK